MATHDYLKTNRISHVVLDRGQWKPAKVTKRQLTSFLEHADDDNHN
jgi:hypothetical protein